MEKGETVDFCHLFVTKLTSDELIFVKSEKQRKIVKGWMIGLNIFKYILNIDNLIDESERGEWKSWLKTQHLES